ncbi:MAG TPA: SAM-dependent methyltransferase [Candidatus Avacidaminococcus intestinavium]|uniref:SAM-dependent methyltransferase n=1 Tax=Candidatus Avacidaminococcus intestinavium TaxID=2840684 RepID=A0A9D1SKH8_9FIRM|nr:SAM-dependent methyltransferase [Candidatus Avacidaminococcus intestinavium]
MKFGARLETIAKWVPQNKKIADIGTDHAYLPVFLVRNGVIVKAIAGDIALGPCQAAVKTITAAGLKESIEVRQGNGLSIVQSEDAVEVIVIAGMGATTMIEIIATEQKTAKLAERIILQPMNGAAQLRKWANRAGWKIVGEDLVLEGGLLYEIIVLEPGAEESYTKAIYEIGPRLLEQRHPLLSIHFERIIANYHKLLQAMNASAKARKSLKYKKIATLLVEVEVLKNEYNRS